jgi:hypothetical protein
MSGLEDFFAAPRKAKSTPKKEVVVKTSPTNLDVTKNELAKDLKLVETVVEKNITNPAKDAPHKTERYKALSKKKVERKFDSFVRKGIQINQEDLLFLNNLERSISFARKSSKIDTEGLNRVTSNTVIRILLEQFCKKAEADVKNNSNLYERLQTEEEIQDWINKL